MKDSAAPALAVVASAPITIWTSDTTQAIASVLLGLLGVAIARKVFIDRENRRLRKAQPWHSTLPLTLAAMLITGVLVWDNKLGLSSSVFTGLGVGWTVILILDLIGDRAMNVIRAALGMPPLPPQGTFPDAARARAVLPPEHVELLDRLDSVPATKPDRAGE